jgi:hypothetical protein
MSLRTDVGNYELNPTLSVLLMAVKVCSKAISTLYSRHGKSPCFSQVTFLSLVGPDYSLSILPCVNVKEFLECAL